MMVKKIIGGNSSKAGEYDYDRADNDINAMAKLFLTKWSLQYEQENDKEKYLLKRLIQLADYMDSTFNDQYVNSLYFQYVHGFTEGISFEIVLKGMEARRRSFVNALQRKNIMKRPIVKTPYVHDGSKRAKWKILIRLLTAQHIAEQLYKQYRRQLKLNDKPVPERTSLLRTIPGMSAWYIRELLPVIKKNT